MSGKFKAAACTLISTSPAPGVGRSTSSITRPCGSHHWCARIAFIMARMVRLQIKAVGPANPLDHPAQPTRSRRCWLIAIAALHDLAGDGDAPVTDKHLRPG